MRRLAPVDRLTVIGAVAIVAFLGCRRQTSDGQPNGRSPQDSAYAAALTNWLRDSTVLDSMTHLVPTDSLFRIFRSALGPTGTTREHVRQMFCEHTRLGIRYGHIPALRAYNRMLDTVYRERGVHDAYEYFMRRAPQSGEVSSCAQSGPAMVKLGNTRLDQELRPRPRRP